MKHGEGWVQNMQAKGTSCQSRGGASTKIIACLPASSSWETLVMAVAIQATRGRVVCLGTMNLEDPGEGYTATKCFQKHGSGLTRFSCLNFIL